MAIAGAASPTPAPARRGVGGRGAPAARHPRPATRCTKRGRSLAHPRSSSCVFNFFLFRVLPGDPIALYTRGRNVPPDQIRELHAPGLRPAALASSSRPTCENPFSQDVDSVKYNAPVWDGDRAARLADAAAGRARPRSSPRSSASGSASGAAGTAAARFDKMSTSTTLVLYSMPEFWFGMILLIVFAVGA